MNITTDGPHVTITIDGATIAGDYRVLTEWDAMHATTPKEAAREAWERIRNSPGPIFTVIAPDGTVTDVDLSEGA